MAIRVILKAMDTTASNGQHLTRSFPDADKAEMDSATQVLTVFGASRSTVLAAFVREEIVGWELNDGLSKVRGDMHVPVGGSVRI